MLKQRIITTAILIPVALLMVFFLPQPFFSIATGIVVLLASWEWASIAGWNLLPLKIVYVILTAALLGLFFWISDNTLLLGTGLAWWIMAIMLIISYPESRCVWKGRPIRLIIGWLVLLPAWASLSIIRSHEHGASLLFYLLAIVWIADIAAYFSGRWFGRHKLAPDISPGKTWQGAIGGCIMVTVLSIVTGAVAGFAFFQQAGMLITTLVVAVFSIFGDLLESMFKRERGVKDSGSLIPGHGGLLDRIDSLTAAAPAFALLWMFFAGL